jgi:hypothetical protein
MFDIGTYLTMFVRKGQFFYIFRTYQYQISQYRKTALQHCTKCDYESFFDHWKGF